MASLSQGSLPVCGKISTEGNLSFRISPRGHVGGAIYLDLAIGTGELPAVERQAIGRREDQEFKGEPVDPVIPTGHHVAQTRRT